MSPKFFHGAGLQGRAGILEGTDERVRHAKFRSPEDVDGEEIRELIDQAFEG